MTETQPIYIKQGRKYVPVANRWHEEANAGIKAVLEYRP